MLTNEKKIVQIPPSCSGVCTFSLSEVEGFVWDGVTYDCFQKPVHPSFCFSAVKHVKSIIPHIYFQTP